MLYLRTSKVPPLLFGMYKWGRWFRYLFVNSNKILLRTKQKGDSRERDGEGPSHSFGRKCRRRGRAIVRGRSSLLRSHQREPRGPRIGSGGGGRQGKQSSRSRLVLSCGKRSDRRWDRLGRRKGGCRVGMTATVRGLSSMVG